MAVEGTDGLGPLRDRPILGPRNCGTALKRIFRSFYLKIVFNEICKDALLGRAVDLLSPFRTY